MTLQDLWMYLEKGNLTIQKTTGELVERYDNHLYINAAVNHISSSGDAILVTIQG